jgi:NAD(P)H-nitrite reductase large subunit
LHIVIIGNGISGTTAARHARKRNPNCHITVVADEADYFFSRTALMYVFMGHMRLQDTEPYEKAFWSRSNINLRRARVCHFDFERKILITAEGDGIHYDKLVLALGSVPLLPEWPGRDLHGVQGFYHLWDLEQLERHTARMQLQGPKSPALVVGGGLIGVELAEMLHARRIEVVWMIREPGFWSGSLTPEESAAVHRHVRRHGIDLRLNTTLSAIQADASGSHCGAVVTTDGSVQACSFVGAAVGVRPNIGALAGSGIALDRGVLVDEYLQTSIPDVYAAGDCAELRDPEPGRRAIEPLWYTGRLMGQALGQTLVGHPTRYSPGVWFNSAKFFDLEYQGYGEVSPKPVQGQQALFWAHPDGERSIRIHYRADSGAVTGFSLLGIRFRHETCDRWINQGCNIKDVLLQLDEACFDEEFSIRYGKMLRNALL